MIRACGMQDASKRSTIDAAREDTRLFQIASELADEEERKRQWRVAKGEVISLFLQLLQDAHLKWPAPELPPMSVEQVSGMYRSAAQQLSQIQMHVAATMHSAYCSTLVILGVFS